MNPTRSAHGALTLMAHALHAELRERGFEAPAHEDCEQILRAVIDRAAEAAGQLSALREKSET